MMNYIQLNRKFSELSTGVESNSKNTDYSLSLRMDKGLTWKSLVSEYRCVILAEAGAGKTKEFEECAQNLQREGKFSFFIRIEDIDSDFIESFEVGDENSFESWLSSTDEAWFFLDSVDEARLDDPRKFHKAIKKFAKKIQSASRRAHIYISSRPYSWRYKEDEDFLNIELFLGLQSDQKKSSLKVLILCPLDEHDLYYFCQCRSVPNIANLVGEIKRFDLLNLAERPFDLDNIIEKWNNQGALGSRSELIQYNIEQRLKDSHTQDRKLASVPFSKLFEGAQRLAAAVMLTHLANIRVPQSKQHKESISASNILPEWTESEICRLLESGIFNDIIYDAVRFRHRDIREFLAAGWFAKLLKSDNRLAVENLFFREQFGEKIVTPALRSILPWLILLDEKICQTLLDIQPEITFENGDPSKLTLNIKRQIFNKFINRISKNLDDRSIRDNDSIAKITTNDLESDVHSLIQTYFENDDVIFFLGRMVWQGHLKSCIPLLKPIALDLSRNIYSRQVSIRAIMSCATKDEKIELWTKINENDEILNKKLITELISDVDPDQELIKLLLISIRRSKESEKYEYSGLDSALEKFAEKCNDELSYQLLEGIAELFAVEPYYEKKLCQISKKYVWLLKIAFQIIEKWVESRNPLVLKTIVIDILINAGALDTYGYTERYNKEEGKKLRGLIPLWEELNDALYWRTIELARQYHWEKKQETLTNDWSVSYFRHFWKFDASSIDRLLNYIDSKELMDDKLIVLNRAFAIYFSENEKICLLEKISNACKNYKFLSNQLKGLISPVLTETQIQHEKMEEHRKLEYEKEMLKHEEDRLKWIVSLQKDPNQLVNSVNFLEGELTNNHYWLMREFASGKISDNRENFSHWELLIPDFGEVVAKTYRDAAVKFWKIYKPQVHSEENLLKNSTPYAVILGLAGLEIEFNENEDLFKELNNDEIKHALRYTTWQLNGFPIWLEKLHKLDPNSVIDKIMSEVIWELETSIPDAEQNYSYILHDLFYHAPWLHADLALPIFQWLTSNSKDLHRDTNKYALNILLNSDIKKESYYKLAQQKVTESKKNGDKAWWFSLLIDSDPEEGIPLFTEWLEKLNSIDATYAAQVFICHLIGGRNSINGKAGQEEIKKVKHLKALYILMHQCIKIEEDIHRAGMEVYSPGLRDKAQDARDLLFKYLSETPCAESYYAIKGFINEHTSEERQIWLRKTSYSIALSCGDIEPWIEEQILQFEFSSEIYPKNHKELFNLAILRINELKDWLENGDDSPWQTWQRAEQETEMRNLIAGHLRGKAQNKYTITQENELANSQRTDIRLENSNVRSPVPIELKILDKSWSGKNLCERLRNQLVGDYLREVSAGCGIFLLVSQQTNKTWDINGKNVSLNQLEQTLQNYWYSIAQEWRGIDSIKVVVIDLNKRKSVSAT